MGAIITTGMNADKTQIIKLRGYIFTIEKYDDGITYSLYKREACDIDIMENNNPQEILDEIEEFLRNAPVPPEEVADEIMKIILASKESESNKNVT